MEVNRFLLTVLDIPRGEMVRLAHCRPISPLISLPCLDSLSFLAPSGGRKCGTWRWRKGYCLGAHALEAPLHIGMRPSLTPADHRKDSLSLLAWDFPGCVPTKHKPSFCFESGLKNTYIAFVLCYFLSGFQNLSGVTIYKLNSTTSPSMGPLTG